MKTNSFLTVVEKQYPDHPRSTQRLMAQAIETFFYPKPPIRIPSLTERFSTFCKNLWSKNEN